MTYTATLPRHVAIIMDGNGRWAERRHRPRSMGHRAGQKAVRATVTASRERGIAALTLFAFSSENWQRPRTEVGALMELFLRALDSEVDELHANGVRLRFIGALEAFAAPLRERMHAAMQRTADNDALTLNIAANYGGRWDIAHAARALAQQVAHGLLDAAAVDEGHLAAHLMLADLPPPDLLIRTGGEHRISNFLLWQAAYAELYFTDTLWPDFDAAALDAALDAYATRERRYGRTGAQLHAGI
ncbi:polyprenyl diphosphate synthase [Metallibacterium scheffleri]|uniref:Ditrans,polycis-undecaprenyl-diphosphate synthase ((2E,6E)-farnesyl-diphosphate specific) n=1 Tax=Metallibacterium scheffleri TaxID=993689 RepID=A0A4S3KKF5_9GAMM|nr:polyprenyl diphosphate synthase [Metallibacterium scheffleri]THD09226.1 di-trans,poly-cis-decaprenylcistransferase [Metallibacterium scheffleri]